MPNNQAANKVMVAGHICLDITPVFPGRRVGSLAEVLSPGKLVQVGQADIHTGGAVSNTGLALHFFGADVVLAAKTGRDAFGRVVRESLEEHGCPAYLVEDAGAGTSYSVVLAVPGIDRMFLHDPGANNTFAAADITDDMLAGVGHFHFGYPPLMRHMYERDGEELCRLLGRVKELGITTSLDMAAVDPASDAGRADWRRILERVLPLVDFFVPSVEEIAFMLDRERYNEWNRRADGGDITRILSPDADIRPLADSLLELGAKAVLIKCGAPGMYYKTATGPAMQALCRARGLDAGAWCGQEGFEQSYLQENVVSGTGAGDTSIAAFLASMLQGHPLERCVQMAAAAGACCIAAHDALSGLEPLDTMWARIEAGWKKERF